MAYTTNVIYLVPSDKSENTTITREMEIAAINMRNWLLTQTLNGKSVLYNDPIVEVVESQYDENWFQTNGAEVGKRYFLNIKAAAIADAGASTTDPNNSWVVMVDAYDLDLHYAGMTYSDKIAIVGISEELNLADGVQSDIENIHRVMAHEFGHVLGLSHTDSGSIMYGAQAGSVLNNYFSEDQRTVIRDNDFITETMGAVTARTGTVTGLSSITA